MGLRTRILGGGDAAIALARRPDALRASLAAAPKEAVDWLGRTPGPGAPRLYRLLVRLSEAFLFGVCRIRVTVEGDERLPREGYMLAAALHRSWIDPLLVIRALPRWTWLTRLMR